MNTATGTHFDGQVARGRVVSLEIHAGHLVISGEGVSQNVDLADVRVSDRLGDIPRFLYLPDGGVIESGDNDMIDAALATRQKGRGAALIHALESRQWLAVVGCLALAAAMVVLGIYGPPALARIVARRVPPDIDQRIGAATLVTIQPYFQGTALSAAEQERVRKQLERLEAADPRVPRPKIVFRSTRADLPNAFALPGNVIIVTDELVRLPIRDDEMAAVLAHELGHLQLRHGLQSLLRQSFALLVVAAVTGDHSTLTSFAGTIPLTILTAGYSRDLERDADRYALNLLRSRHIDPHAFVTALVKIEDAVPATQRVATYLSTHPATEERTALFGGISAAQKKIVLAEPWLDRATQAMGNHDYVAAIVDCGRWIDRAPSAQAYTLRARCHLLHNEPKLGIDDTNQALALDPKYEDALVARAEILDMGEKRFDDALAVARQALAIDPKSGTAEAVVGHAELMKGDLPAAAAVLDHAVQDAPSDFHGWAYRALLKWRQKNLSGAQADYDTALKIAPKEDGLRADRGFLRATLKDYRGAVADLSAVTDPAHETFQLFGERAFSEEWLGDHASAITDYTIALTKNPPAPMRVRLLIDRANVYVRTRKYDWAIADYDAALALNTKNGPAHVLRAITLDNSGDPAKAPADLDAAVQAGIAPNAVLLERAYVQWDLGHYRDAFAVLDVAAGEKPNAAAFRARGMLEFALGKWDNAADDFHSYFFEQTPTPGDYVVFYQFLASRFQKQFDQGQEFSDRIANWPDGWAKTVGSYLAGKITESDLLHECYARGTPSTAERLCEAHFYIGVIYLIADDTVTAKNEFRSCIATGITDYEEYRLARTEIARLENRAPDN